MAFNLEIPKELSHLKIDRRGYPIPYFITPTKIGDPDFRFIHPERVKMIVDRNVCWVCGKRLIRDCFYFIGGPMGLKNRVTTDAAMHLLCAEFSLRACPQLYLEKAQYRKNDELGQMLDKEQINQFHVKDKPSELFLIKADKFKLHIEGKQMYIRYRPVSQVRYVYENNVLVKAEA